MARIDYDGRKKWTAFLPMPDGTIWAFWADSGEGIARIVRDWKTACQAMKRALLELDKIRERLAQTPPPGVEA